MVDRAESVVFWIFAVPLIISALGVIAAKNPVNAAMSLVVSFFFLAAMYVLLVAHLLAFMQVLVYAGAIMVLFLFVIMLLTTADEEFARTRVKLMQMGGVAGALGVTAVIVRAVFQAGTLPMPTVAPQFGT